MSASDRWAAGTIYSLAEQGETVTYTPVGGEAVELSAIVDRETLSRDSGPVGSRQARRAKVSVSTAAANGIADPALGGAVEVPLAPGSATKWTGKILSRDGGDAGLWMLEIEELSPDEYHRRGFRQED